MKTELWKKIEYGNGNYQISNFGRIRNTLAKTRWEQGNILSPQAARDGYLRIRLWHNKIYKCFSVHRLVAKAFCENKHPFNATSVHHKNHIKDDNKSINLEWVTPTKNSREKDSTLEQYTKRIVSNTIQELLDMGIIRISEIAPSLSSQIETAPYC